MNVGNIKAIVFDLDGTLYEDTHHFDYYAKRLNEKVSPEYQSLFMKDYQAALKDEHPLKIGRVYDVKQDLILVQLNGMVIEAYRWDGTPVDKDEMKKLYPTHVTFDLTSMLNVGDLWWIPGSIARHYGLNDEQSYKAFLETREFMMSDAFQMNPVPNFKETLESIHSHVKLTLLTNSPEPDSEQIISKLGLSDVFHLKVFEGRKPTRTEERFAAIKNHFQVDYEEILSVGDNWINEILPANKLGCKTIFIDPHKLGEEDSADMVVENIAGVIPVLKQFVR